MSLLFVPRPRPEQFENSPCHYEPQDDLEYVPLTADALKRLADSLPQPISTVRYSNRENDFLFSDRESVYCPSLVDSRVSTTSTRTSMVCTPDGASDEIQFDIAPLSVPPAIMASPLPRAAPAPKAKKIDKGGLDMDGLFDIDLGMGGFARRNSTVDFLPDFDQIDDYTPDERTAARMEEEKEMEKARLLFEKELEDDYPVTVARKPVMPTSLWISQPRHIMTPNFVPSPKVTELTIPVSSSNIEPSSSSGYFPKTQSSFNSVESTASVSTDITTPSLGEDDFSEVDDEFVDTVFTYLSINHNSMGRKFDDELSIGSGFPVEKVQKDRKAALRVYIERYVFHHPEIPSV